MRTDPPAPTALSFVCARLPQSEAKQSSRGADPAQASTLWPDEVEGRGRHDSLCATIYAARAEEAKNLVAWLEVAAQEFEQGVGYPLPKGVVLVIEPGPQPWWALHRYLRIRSRSKDPLSFYLVHNDEPWDLHGGFVAPLEIGAQLGLPDPTEGEYYWVCFLVSDSFARAWAKDYIEAVFHEVSHSAGGPGATWMLVPLMLMKNRIAAYCEEVVAVQRRAVLFEAAGVGLANQLQGEVRLRVDSAIAELRSKLETLREHRPTIRD
jgi:hypothetical protein